MFQTDSAMFAGVVRTRYVANWNNKVANVDIYDIKLHNGNISRHANNLRSALKKDIVEINMLLTTYTLTRKF